MESRFRCQRCWWWPQVVKRLLFHRLQGNPPVPKGICEYVILKGGRVFCKDCATRLGHTRNLGVRLVAGMKEEAAAAQAPAATSAKSEAVSSPRF